MTTSQIADTARTTVALGIQAKLPEKQVLLRSVQRARRRAGNVIADPIDLNFAIPQNEQNIELKDPHGGSQTITEPFLLYDSGPGNDRILIFGSNNSRNILSQARQWYADGTFKISPPNFAQLLTILAKYPDDSKNVIPCFYCLLTNKTQQTYERCFREVCLLKKFLTFVILHFRYKF